MLVLSTPDKRIKYLSESYHGSCHDFRILKEEFPAERGQWFKDKRILLDSGFQGFVKEYGVRAAYLPKKKKAGCSLSEDEKVYNKALSSERIVVENAIGGMKRYRMLYHVVRCKDFRFYDEMAGVCAGLWNFNLDE